MIQTRQVLPGRKSGGAAAVPARQTVQPPSFYTTPPGGEVSMDEFASLALDRMNALRDMEKICGYDAPLASALKALLDAEARVDQSLTRFNLLHPDRGDAISHNILRLAFCRSEENKKWFLRNEERLFAYRLQRFTKLAEPATVRVFLREHGIARPEDVVDNAHANTELYAELVNVTADATRASVFYGLPFAEVPPHLLARRMVVVRRGIAYLPQTELRFVAARKFRKKLEEALLLAPQCAAMVERDPRLGPLIQEMSSLSWSGPQQTTAIADDEKLSLGNWQLTAQRSFPPCMRNLVEQMYTKRKHLKYKGRTQLQPFMKSAGFTLEESMHWWRDAMTKDPTVDSSKFDKEYTYGVKYTYGKVGNMKEKGCFKCQTVIQQPFPAGEEAHGCPFRHNTAEDLTNMLRGWGVSETAIQEVLGKVRDTHYELACRDLFKAKHPGSDGEEMGNHPMQFYQESVRYYLAKEKPVKAEPAAAVKAEPIEAPATPREELPPPIPVA